MKLDLEYVFCNLCGRDDYKVVYKKKSSFCQRIFNVVQCRNCGLVFLNPRVAKDDLAKLYSHFYYEQRGFTGCRKGEKGDCEILARCLKEGILKNLNRRPKLLDIGGYYYGTLVSVATEMGFDAELVDISESAISIAKIKGATAYKGEITDSFFDERLASYDVITAMEVIEHCYDPMAFVKRIFELLKRGGVFVYTTGNFKETRFKGIKWAYFDEIPYHVYFFTPRTIMAYFKKIGFSEFLDPYSVIYNNRDLGVRVLSKIGLIDIKEVVKPSSFLAKVAYTYFFKAVASIIGRKRLPFPVK